MHQYVYCVSLTQWMVLTTKYWQSSPGISTRRLVTGNRYRPQIVAQVKGRYLSPIGNDTRFAKV